jgi:CubicO group peptidase (beta-lactamase class C family)
MKNLHVYEGTDYSAKITIRDLLSHTSGLPDYFSESTAKEISIEEMRKTNGDGSYTTDDVLDRTKTLAPHFAPGSKGKAYYSDGNYQLLGIIIERVTGRPLNEAYQDFIFRPLKLENTYLQVDKTQWGIAPIYNGTVEIQVPAILASERSAGGIVSTAGENMLFIKAFFAGELFPREYLEQMTRWNKIFFPMEYGSGLMKCGIPIPFIKLKGYELIGHSGSTGTVSYYCPARDVYIVGTTQQTDAAKAMQVAYQILMCFNYE